MDYSGNLMSSIIARAVLSSIIFLSGNLPRYLIILLLSITRIYSHRTTESCIIPGIPDSINTCDGKSAFLIFEVKGAIIV